MKVNYDEMLQYVQKLLDKYDAHGGISKTKINYSRFMHTRRVLRFANRIYHALPEEQKEKIDYEALVIAVIFHDSGYGQIERTEHAVISEKVCREYLNRIGYDEEKTEIICKMIRDHSQKDLLRKEDIPLEFIILLEADLLDDTGAHGIVMDIWIESLKEGVSFESILEHIRNYSYSEMQNNPMRTEPSIKLWEAKRKLTEEFVRQYESDLEV